jgi:Resolvase, N terminal domain
MTVPGSVRHNGDALTGRDRQRFCDNCPSPAAKAASASRTRVRNQRRTTRPVTGCCDSPGIGHLLGYARVSTTDRQPQLQVDALQRAGSYPSVVVDTASGARADRPILEQVLHQLRPATPSLYGNWTGSGGRSGTWSTPSPTPAAHYIVAAQRP